jgi:hypothetical protein
MLSFGQVGQAAVRNGVETKERVATHVLLRHAPIKPWSHGACWGKLA